MLISGHLVFLIRASSYHGNTKKVFQEKDLTAFTSHCVTASFIKVHSNTNTWWRIQNISGKPGSMQPMPTNIERNPGICTLCITHVTVKANGGNTI